MGPRVRQSTALPGGTQQRRVLSGLLRQNRVRIVCRESAAEVWPGRAGLRSDLALGRADLRLSLALGQASPKGGLALGQAWPYGGLGLRPGLALGLAGGQSTSTSISMQICRSAGN